VVEDEPEFEVSVLDAPEVDDPEFEEAEFDDPELDPVFEPLGAPGVPGNVPHGDPLGVVPGVVEVFGFTVEGCVLLPLDGGFVEFDPGTPEGDVGGFTEPVGGAVGLLVGGAEEGVAPGAWLRPAEPELPVGGAPPAGAVCAATQVAQKRRTERNVSILEDIE
jgi:hypothetical protein